MKRTVKILFVVFTFVSSATWAQLPSQSNVSGGGNEFFVGKEFGKPLVRVNLINGVNTPGVYHVPNDTNLAELLAYAGGAAKQSDLSEVNIRRGERQETKTIQVDLENVIEGTSSIPGVASGDVIHIKQKTGIESTQKYVTLISGVLSIALSYFIIDDIRDR